MSTGRSLHFVSANASLSQLTKQLQQEEDKVLQVCILHGRHLCCIPQSLAQMLMKTTCLKLPSTVPQHAEFRFAVQAQAAVDKRAEELDKQAEALAHEKLKMSAVGVADNDVLDLNVGGVSLSVKRATLTQVSWSTTATQSCLDFASLVL